MKSFLYISFFLVISGNCFSQAAKLTLVSNPFIVFSGGTPERPIKLTIDNSDIDAIELSTAQTTGGIISEGDYNQVVWNVENSTGVTYTVPFTKSAAGPAIPVNITITSAGTQLSKGSIAISTFGTGWDNSTQAPDGVTTMAALGRPNNSDRVIDRFWLLEASDYSTKPAITLEITYDDAEHTAAGNSIIEANLQAQRFSMSNSNWDGFGPAGTADPVLNVVSGIAVAAADFERPWTLVDNRNPLPIELIEFKADCDNAQRNIYWTTATETNNHYFTIEKSIEGVEFKEIGKIMSLADAGNSTSTIKYNYIDNNNVLGDYYRLKQTDFDGSFEYSQIIYNKCEEENVSSVDLYPNPSKGIFNVLLTGLENQNIYITVIDHVGKKIFERNIIGEPTTQKETFDLTDFAKGIYYVNIVTDKEKFTQKIVHH